MDGKYIPLIVNGNTYHFDTDGALAEVGQTFVIHIRDVCDSQITAKRVFCADFAAAEKIAEDWLYMLLRRNPGLLMSYAIEYHKERDI